MSQQDYIKKYLGESLNIENGLNEDLIPSLYLEIIHEYLTLKFPYVNPELFISNLNLYFAHWLTYQRVTINEPGRPQGVYPNYYTIIFSPSGSGKDAVQTTIRKEIGGMFFERYKSDCIHYYNAKKESLEQEVLDNADFTLTDKGLKKEVKNKMREYPRLIVNVATKEGYTRNRENFQFYNFGSSALIMSELTDYLLSGRVEEKGLIEKVVQSWEEGSDPYVKLKLSDDNIPVNNVPNNVLAFSAINGLVGSREYKDFIKILSRGLARRSFILVLDIDKEKILEDAKSDPLEVAMQEGRNLVQSVEMGRVFEEKIRACLSVPIKGQMLQLTEDAQSSYLVYKGLCRTRHASTPDHTNDGVQAELLTRHSKMIRLAGVFAKVEDFQTLIVEKHHIQQAIHWTEYTSKYLQDLVNQKPEYKIILALNTKGVISMSDAYAYMYGDTTYNRVRAKKELEEMIPIMRDIVGENGKDIVYPYNNEEDTRQQCLKLIDKNDVSSDYE